MFLTNNSGCTPRELQQKLARMGLDVSENHFYTSALATATFLKDQAPNCSVYAIGEAGLFNALYDKGITMNDVNPDYVVVGEGKTYSLDTLTKATNLVLKGEKTGDSYGNGASMRISPVGLFYDDLKFVLSKSKEATIPSHNNEEAIIGAQAVTTAIYLSRNNYSKEPMTAIYEILQDWR